MAAPARPPCSSCCSPPPCSPAAPAPPSTSTPGGGVGGWEGHGRGAGSSLLPQTVQPAAQPLSRCCAAQLHRPCVCLYPLSPPAARPRSFLSSRLSTRRWRRWRRPWASAACSSTTTTVRPAVLLPATAPSMCCVLVPPCRAAFASRRLHLASAAHRCSLRSLAPQAPSPSCTCPPPSPGPCAWCWWRTTPTVSGAGGRRAARRLWRLHARKRWVRWLWVWMPRVLQPLGAP